MFVMKMNKTLLGFVHPLESALALINSKAQW